jgi:hypothetical protein
MILECFSNSVKKIQNFLKIQLEYRILYMTTCVIYDSLWPNSGAYSGAVGWFLMVSLEFFIDINLLAALRPWGPLSLQQKWKPGIFSRG